MRIPPRFICVLPGPRKRFGVGFQTRTKVRRTKTLLETSELLASSKLPFRKNMSNHLQTLLLPFKEENTYYYFLWHVGEGSNRLGHATNILSEKQISVIDEICNIDVNISYWRIVGGHKSLDWCCTALPWRLLSLNSSSTTRPFLTFTPNHEEMSLLPQPSFRFHRSPAVAR